MLPDMVFWFSGLCVAWHFERSCVSLGVVRKWLEYHGIRKRRNKMNMVLRPGPS